MSSAGLAGALRRVWQPLVIGLIVGVVVWAFFTSHVKPGVFGFDFRGTLWDAARVLAHGASPYPAPDSPLLADGNPALYPPFTIAAVIPLSWLSWGLAIGIWTALEVAGALLGTWLLGVRDWRCYCVVLTSLPFLQGLLYGNLSLLLLLGVGAAWRYRERTLAGGLSLAVVVAAKLFLWPLAILGVVPAARRCGSRLDRRRARARARPLGSDRLRRAAALSGAASRGGRSLRAAHELAGCRRCGSRAAARDRALAPVRRRRCAARSRRSRVEARRRRSARLCTVRARRDLRLADRVDVLPRPPRGPDRRAEAAGSRWLWAVLPAMYLVDWLLHHPPVQGTPPNGVLPGAWGALHTASPTWQALGVSVLLAVVAAAALTLPLVPDRGRYEDSVVAHAE